jgi:hypothetical protein
MAFEKKEKAKEQAEDKYAPTKIIFETLDKNEQSHKMLSTDTIIDPETGKVRKIRLAHGASTIFMDEMQPYELDLPLVNLIFFKRKLECTVGAEDLKIQFLRLTDQNKDKEKRMPNRKPAVFRELKPLADIKAKREKLALANKAETLATTCKDEEMFPFAHVLGINIDQDPEYVRVEFIEVARIRPDYFLKYFDNPKNQRQYNVSNGLSKGVIRVEGGIAIWNEGKKKIVEVPSDKDVKSFLADYAGTDEGRAFYEALKKLI